MEKTKFAKDLIFDLLMFVAPGMVGGPRGSHGQTSHIVSMLRRVIQPDSRSFTRNFVSPFSGRR